MNSSDMELAKELSRRIVAGVSPPAESREEQEKRPPFIFSAKRSSRAELSPPLPLAEVGSWEELLNWLLAISAAETSFIVDTHGFVIAEVGNIPEEGCEGLGAELCYFMEQLERIDSGTGQLQKIQLTFNGHDIRSFRIASPTGESYLIGLLGQTGPDRIMDSILRDEFRAKLVDLT